MPQRPPAPRSTSGRRRLGVALFGCLLVLAACDTVAPEPITLPVRDVTFEFAFRSDTLGGGEIVVASANRANLAGQLEGFSKEEILAAEVVSVELERIEPPLTNLDALLTSAALELTVDGGAPRTVGTASSLPADFEADLTPSGGDVGAVLRAPSFGARLRLVPRTLPDDRFEFQVRVALRIEVEGV